MENRTDQQIKHKKLKGLVIIGLMWIIGALGHMRALTDFEWYQYSVSNQGLLGWMVSLRYVVSWTQRFLGITVGVGLIAHRRWARQMAIFLSVFNILTVYWRFTYQTFVNQSVVWDRELGGIAASLGYPEIRFSSYCLQATIATRALDIAFFSVVIYYLTRGHIKRHLI